MRDIITSQCVRSPAGFSPLLCTTKPSLPNEDSISHIAISHPVSPGRPKLSQANRRTAMRDNSKDALAFMNQQHKVLQQLIKEFQIFIGYREQLPRSQSGPIPHETWSVYLMHAQSLHHAMKQNYMGKALFGSGAEPPVRVHLEQNGVVEPFDLPDPSLESLVSIRAFLGGVPDHRLPSVELGNACMAELLNALVQIQDGREKLNHISKRLPMHKPLYESSSLSHGSYRTNTGQSLSWIDRFISVVTSLIRTAIPAKSLG